MQAEGQDHTKGGRCAVGIISVTYQQFSVALVSLVNMFAVSDLQSWYASIVLKREESGCRSQAIGPSHTERCLKDKGKAAVIEGERLCAWT